MLADRRTRSPFANPSVPFRVATIRDTHIAKIWLACALVLLSAISNGAAGQEQPARPRPKIGLVLSGGGARGMAHIGVLEWLEEHRIPIDYVAGTSMGGLVGGAYAMGMTPAEIRTFATSLDWEMLLRNGPAYQELSFRRKEDRRATPSSIELGARGGLKLPLGINSGNYIGLVLDRLSLPYSTVRTFDELPIPFRCVATDMLAAQQLVLKDGPLAEALRATMAIPGVFDPVVTEDKKILADGGLLNNIPADVGRAMGADIIIVVNIGSPLRTRENLEGLGGMLGQVIGVMTIESDRRNLKLADYVITPDLGPYTLLDFNAASVIADLGYQGAAKQAVVLERFALDDSSWRDHLARRYARKKSTLPVPTQIAVAGIEGRQAAEIGDELKGALNQPISPNKLEHKLNEIRGGGRYESLGYDISLLEKEPRLRISVREKSYGPPLITPVLLINSDGAADLELSAGFRLTSLDLWSYGAELRTDVLIGSHNLLGAEYFRPLASSQFFVAPRAYYSSSRVNLYRGEDRAEEYLVRTGSAAVDLGYIFNRRTQLRTGFELGHANAEVDIGDPLLPTVEGVFSNVSTRFVYEGQDNATVPTHGLRLTANAYWYFKSPGAAQGFPQAEVTTSYFAPFGKRGTVFGFGAGGTSFDKTLGPIQQFTLGGPFRLSAYGRNEFRGNDYFFLGGGYLYHLTNLPPIIGDRVYLGGWYEGGSAFLRRSDLNFRNDIAGGLILETALGPITFGGAWGEGGRGKFFFSLGRLF